MDVHFLRKRNLDELLRTTSDDSGFIEGKVFMTWPLRNVLHRINLEVAQDSALYRFEVEIPHREGIAFRPHERVFLALKGMKLDRRKESSAPHYFPITLRFPNGVIFKYLSGTNAGRIVDTWEGNTDEWYNPSPVCIDSDSVIIDASKTRSDAVPTESYSPVPTSLRRDHASGLDAGVEADGSHPSVTAAEDGADIAQSVPHPTAEKRGRSSRSRRKKRRLQKERESAPSAQLANDIDRPCPAEVAPHHEPPQISMHGSAVSDGHPKLLQVTEPTNGEISVQDTRSGLSRGENDSDAISIQGEVNVPQLKAGFRTERGDVFTALGDLRKGHSMIDVIAVVASVQPERKTRTNEWTRSFTLVDPSTIDSPRQNLRVNCFQKKYVEWLPQVQKDDVVILRRLKTAELSGVVLATGYGDKLRWAVYDPLQHSIRPPNKGCAPTKEVMDDGMGYEYSPYWEPFPDSTVLEYCRQIGEWWKVKNTLDGQNVLMVQSSTACKQHLLISEASPDLPPQGFFNCTVEVLQKFDNHGGATVVYVTDYTANTLVHPVQATWCPPELYDRVLQCDMWDNAKNVAKMMNPGEYWYLYNIRAKWNPSHYMEGTMQLAEKITQLDATKPEEQPHLNALLLRKDELGLNKSNLVSGSISSHIFPDMLLQDVDGSTSFLTCTVELLHNDPDSRDGHFIYVTDYTYNADLPTAVSTADWAHNLQHRVLKIKLDDAQAKTSSDLRSGSVIVIQNLRIKRSNPSGCVHGCLGGEHTLIRPLPDLSSYPAQALERNKEKWKRENVLDGLTALSSESHEEVHEPLRQASHSVDDITIRQALERPAPSVFRVLSRVVDFFPFSLEDASALRCTKCKLSPSSSLKGCPTCDDMLDTHCKWFYCLYVLLRDEQGGELFVSLSGKECTLLQEVTPTDFRYDQATFCRFLAKLDPILGNLKDVHAAWLRNEQKAVESPWMLFTIESWNVGDEKGHGLLNCIPGEGIGL